MKVELSARECHFLDHLLPVWRELPPDARGTVFVGSEEVAARARALLEEPVVVGWPTRDRSLGPVLVAAWGDLRVTARTRRRAILFEHGAGQHYGARHPSYVGGPGREKVALFVVPSRQAAARNRRYYPAAPVVAVGSPRVDELRKLESPSGSPTVAVSFHWRCPVAPETGTGLDDFAPELAATRARLADSGVELIGHAHPRILDEARTVYRSAGIELVADFADVVRRAHVYAVDNSSTLFEFAALDRPVVVLNPRAYRRSVSFGLRFWSEADVGIHAAPGELADRLLDALEDRPEVAASRKAAVARVYAVTDGTSSARAARAIVNLLDRRRGCLVCGTPSCACGPETTTFPIDDPARMETPRMRHGTKKRYPNPDRPGAFLKLSDRDAARLGLLGTGEPLSAPGPAATEVTNTGPDAALVSPSSDSETPETSETPGETREAVPDAPGPSSGALQRSGPTHRARTKNDEGDEDDEGEAKTKKRPAPTSRRRPRAPKTEEG